MAELGPTKLFFKEKFNQKIGLYAPDWRSGVPRTVRSLRNFDGGCTRRFEKAFLLKKKSLGIPAPSALNIFSLKVR